MSLRIIRNFLNTSSHFNQILSCTDIICLMTVSQSRARGCHDKGGKFKWTVGAVVGKWKQEFKKSNISEPKESAEYIMAHVLGTKKVSDVYRSEEKLLSPTDVEQIDILCRKRLERMPVQYIIQEWDFRDLTLKMSRPVFIPRPETEALVDIVLTEIDSKRADNVLELCCGSGAISLALLKSRTQLRATAIDRSEDACRLAEANAKITGLSSRLGVIKGEIGEDFGFDLQQFDIIVSNPPYVPRKDLDQLQDEIKFYEDPAALDGGDDGLSVIKSILEVSSRLLNCGGKLFLEVDPSHPTLIQSWLKQNDRLRLVFLRSFADFSGKERFVEVMKEK